MPYNYTDHFINHVSGNNLFLFESCMKHINTLCGNVQSPSGTNAYHWALKWKTFTVDTHTHTRLQTKVTEVGEQNFQ
jgi:hypothetical protein